VGLAAVSVPLAQGRWVLSREDRGAAGAALGLGAHRALRCRTPVLGG